MSTALTYIVLGCANLLGSQPPPTGSQIVSSSNPSLDQGRVQVITTRVYNYTLTPGVGIHKINARPDSWNNARRTCEAEGGHLAIINSVAEAEVIAKMLTNLKINEAYIGAHDFYAEGDFVTIHGESLADAGFDVWNQGEPSNGGGRETCLVLKAHGTLNDLECSVLKSFICEVPYDHLHVQENPPLPAPAPEITNPGTALEAQLTIVK